jgi:ferritin-like metal-binding protein YciE
VQAFQHIDQPARGKTCEAMKGLIEEGSEVTEEVEDGGVRDAAMITAGQLGHGEAAGLLAQTLEEEKAAWAA